MIAVYFTIVKMETKKNSDCYRADINLSTM